jgi:hypothetical protein
MKKINILFVAAILAGCTGTQLKVTPDIPAKGVRSQSTQVKDTEPDQQGLLVMNLCGLGLRCREFDRPGRWL